MRSADLAQLTAAEAGELAHSLAMLATSAADNGHHGVAAFAAAAFGDVTAQKIRAQHPELARFDPTPLLGDDAEHAEQVAEAARSTEVDADLLPLVAAALDITAAAAEAHTIRISGPHLSGPELEGLLGLCVDRRDRVDLAPALRDVWNGFAASLDEERARRRRADRDDLYEATATAASALTVEEILNPQRPEAGRAQLIPEGDTPAAEEAGP